jgi:hypothetical protein
MMGRKHKKDLKLKIKKTGIIPHSLYEEVSIEILENPLKGRK